MAFEEGDLVLLQDKHSEFDGEVGTVTQVVETMFGDANYTVSFDDGEEAGVPEDNLEEAEEEPTEEAEEESEEPDESSEEAEKESEETDEV